MRCYSMKDRYNNGVGVNIHTSLFYQREGSMKVAVDHTKCVGCGQCAQICPQVFELQNGASAVLVPVVPQECEDLCRDAADRCPVGAITVSE